MWDVGFGAFVDVGRMCDGGVCANLYTGFDGDVDADGNAKFDADCNLDGDRNAVTDIAPITDGHGDADAYAIADCDARPLRRDDHRRPGNARVRRR